MAQGASAEVDSIPTPWFGEDLDAAQPTALFSSSRSSSPIQLNLLQEELTKPTEALNSTGPEILLKHHAKEVRPTDIRSDLINSLWSYIKYVCNYYACSFYDLILSFL